MNPESQEVLKSILANEPAALSEGDIAFLRARRSYLSEEQLAVYASVLEEQPVSETAPADGAASQDVETAAEQPRVRRVRRASAAE